MRYRVGVELWTAAGSLVWQARTGARLTQRDLGVACGVPQSTIAAIERGRRQPSIPLLQRILRGAGMEVRLVLEPLDDHDASLVGDEDRDRRVAELFHSGRVVG
jgi:transcriptional regulator with XRE-family HTH domain